MTRYLTEKLEKVSDLALKRAKNQDDLSQFFFVITAQPKCFTFLINRYRLLLKCGLFQHQSPPAVWFLTLHCPYEGSTDGRWLV